MQINPVRFRRSYVVEAKGRYANMCKNHYCLLKFLQLLEKAEDVWTVEQLFTRRFTQNNAEKPREFVILVLNS